MHAIRLALFAGFARRSDTRLPFGLNRLFANDRAAAAAAAADVDHILRRELERMRSLSPHLLADIGIDCAQDAPLDDVVRLAHRLTCK